jgi:hypothetical protein
VELGGAQWPGIGGGVSELRRLEVGDGAANWGLVVRGTRERRPAWEGVNQKGKRTSANAPSTRGSRLAARSVGLKIRKKNFRIKNWIFEFTKDLEFCRRRFRRNFDMRIFPKFF